MSALPRHKDSLHSHPELHLSGLKSSCRVSSRLPSGLRCLADSGDAIRNPLTRYRIQTRTLHEPPSYHGANGVVAAAPFAQRRI